MGNCRPDHKRLTFRMCRCRQVYPASCFWFALRGSGTCLRDGVPAVAAKTLNRAQLTANITECPASLRRSSKRRLCCFENRKSGGSTPPLSDPSTGAEVAFAAGSLLLRKTEKRWLDATALHSASREISRVQRTQLQHDPATSFRVGLRWVVLSQFTYASERLLSFDDPLSV